MSRPVGQSDSADIGVDDGLTSDVDDSADDGIVWQWPRKVLLRGCGLIDTPRPRWAGQSAHTVLDTGFGLGHAFIATWQAWRRCPQRPQRLHYLALEAAPPEHAVLQRALHRDTAGSAVLAPLAQALCADWPPLAPGLHALDFEGGRVRLLLGVGRLQTLLPQLQAQVDSFLIGAGSALCSEDPQQLPLIKRLGRLAAPGAMLATTADTALGDHPRRALHAGLRTAGFETGHRPETQALPAHTVARFAPRGRRRGSAAASRPADPRAVVVGAGLAGAAVARALADRGWQVQVLDRHAQPAAEASGNPAGLFHGSVQAQDGPHARLLRAAALHAERWLRPAIAAGLPGAIDGLLHRAAPGTELAAMQAMLDVQGLPAGYLQALPAAQASELAGVALDAPAWFYPGGGWVDPGAWVRWLLQGLALRTGSTVAAVQRTAADVGSLWHALDASGRLLAQAPVLVLACPASVQALAAPWRLGRSRGQIDGWRGAATAINDSDRGMATPLRLPLSGEGYALPLRGGLLYGATVQRLGSDAATDPWPDAVPAPDADTAARDRAYNDERLRRLCGLAPPADGTVQPLQRTALRLQSADKLPLLGPVAGAPGLWVATALGARGITWAPLLADLLAARLDGEPWPLARDLAMALDPSRPGLLAAPRDMPQGAG